MEFIPDKVGESIEKLPYFEDITAKDVAGKGVTKSHAYYQERIEKLLIKLGANEIQFYSGRFELPAGQYTVGYRYGFQVSFRYKGHKGHMECAALPLKTVERWSDFPKRKDRALAQALYLLGNHLQSELDSKAYRPGAAPLVPYLLGEGDKTVTEIVVGGLMDKLPRFQSNAPQIAAANGKHDVITVLPEEITCHFAKNAILPTGRKSAYAYGSGRVISVSSAVRQTMWKSIAAK